jgi:phosphoadenosine phosphosulfate reductase
MALIRSDRHSASDLSAWRRLEETARLHAQLKSHRNRIRQSIDAVASFTGSADGCYAGVSWGKDSVVLAHMIATLCPRVPLVWVRVEPIANPDCHAVRDAFLACHRAANYHEIETWCVPGDDGDWHATGSLESGFREAERRFGHRHLSGIRADESGIRKLRVAKHGLQTANTCAPIGRWDGMDVWAYLVTRDLPIHPAYACSLDGLLDHSRIRVASLGGKRGCGWGRAEWEARYYHDALIRIERASRA